MSSNKRFIKSITEAAKADAPAMPWARVERRAAFIAKRDAQEIETKAA